MVIYMKQYRQSIYKRVRSDYKNYKTSKDNQIALLMKKDVNKQIREVLSIIDNVNLGRITNWE